MSLTDFLLARIIEDEAVARETTWQSEHYSVFSYLRAEDGRHVARHDPSRVLADCEAHAQILKMHVEGEAWCDYCEPPDGRPDACPTLQALALSYVHHPEYDERWKPAR